MPLKFSKKNFKCRGQITVFAYNPSKIEFIKILELKSKVSVVVFEVRSMFEMSTRFNEKSFMSKLLDKKPKQIAKCNCKNMIYTKCECCFLSAKRYKIKFPIQ